MNPARVTIVICLLAVLLATATGCGKSNNRERWPEVRVLATPEWREVLEPQRNEHFERGTGYRVEPTIVESGELAAALASAPEGKAWHLVLAGDPAVLDALERDGHVTGAPWRFDLRRLDVRLWGPADDPDARPDDLSDYLTSRTLAIPTMENNYTGRIVEDWMVVSGVRERVKGRLKRFGTLDELEQLIETGAVDAAAIVETARLSEGVSWRVLVEGLDAEPGAPRHLCGTVTAAARHSAVAHGYWNYVETRARVRYMIPDTRFLWPDEARRQL